MRTYKAHLSNKVKGVSIVGSHLFYGCIYVFTDITVYILVFYGYIYMFE